MRTEEIKMPSIQIRLDALKHKQQALTQTAHEHSRKALACWKEERHIQTQASEAKKYQEALCKTREDLQKK